ncbi:hypothetical protein [uncultured Thomasclavelia sp.]|uniref:hypothetical protein n=1 Tax=uncultured Thomasclavelia sp. TaxID=3025759 RepID=UPI002594FB1A|nr:hypothetical protein [uncultured Thomasclavelia sp.]
MSNIGSGANAGSLQPRNYHSIRGVDFSQRKDEVSLYRSPDMINLWKNYKNSNGLCIETRPGLELLKEYTDNIYGLYFYTYNNERHLIVHSGTKLYDNDNMIYDGLEEHSSSFFVYGTKLYLLDSKKYYVYNGEVFKEVEGFIPTTTISRGPLGGGNKIQDVNYLSPYRKNSFCSDGETLDYHLDVEWYDSDYNVLIWINDKLVDNSEKVPVFDKNGYLKYIKDTSIYWYDEANELLYNADYEQLINGELHNNKGYIKYKNNNGKIYWYDSIYKAVYDEEGNDTNINVSTLTKIVDNTTLSQLTKVIDYPYSEDPTKGIITFSTPPVAPFTDGADNVVIQFKRTISGYRERITNCTLIEMFDNRVFFSGNPNFPNVLWHCSLDDPTYCSDTDYYEEGVSDSAVKGIVAGNNALWVIKEPSQTNTTIFYHNPTIDGDHGKIYPSSHSSISTGCLGGARNFKDKIVFFSDRGMEGISSDVTTEQVITHMSTLVDNKLLNENNYKNMLLEEWEGYLLVCIEDKIYLADGSNKCINNNHEEYEWFYWELETKINGVLVDNNILYLCSDNKIYTLSDIAEERQISSCFTTIDDEFNYPQMQKITNKRGCVIDINGTKIDLYVKTDKTEFEKIDTFNITKGRIIPKIKRKKWKSIQLQLKAKRPFYFYSATLESYITNYLKK